jgi:hypothetical protein
MLMGVKSGAMISRRLLDTAFPDMTSNVLPAGYVASSNDETSGAAWKAFDGIEVAAANMWGANSDVAYLQIQFPTQRLATAYTIFNRGSVTSQAPTEWTLKGSNDGVGFTIIDTRTGITPWLASEAKTFQVAAPGAYTYYRLDITDNSISSTVVTVGELNFTFIDG